MNLHGRFEEATGRKGKGRGQFSILCRGLSLGSSTLVFPLSVCSCTNYVSHPCLNQCVTLLPCVHSGFES